VHNNPSSDGRIRSRTDAIVRGAGVGAAIVIAWNTPHAWYWRIAIFFGIMVVLGIIYPVVQQALSKKG
jgi:hypothetical protein